MPLDAAPQGIDPVQANMFARNIVLRNSVNMTQGIYTRTFTGANASTVGLTIDVPLKNVGLVKRLYVRISATVQANGQTLTLCPFGPNQMLSNVVYTDTSNQNRINTTGWHLFTVSSAKRRGLLGAAYTTDSASGFGANFPSVMFAPTTITTNPTENNVFWNFEVPLSYTDMDLRGSVYMNVTNATSTLQLKINPNFFIASGSDPTFGVYKSNTATLGNLTSITVEVYQNYLDQIPQAQNGGPVLPLLDMSTAYMLQNTPIQANTSNQDIPVTFANFRDFLSTTIILDNNGTLNTGSDVVYWALQAANYTNIFKYSPYISAFFTRGIFGDDPPPGTYYFDHREKPISTIQYGNQQIILNGTGLASNAFMAVGWEMMALINMVTQAGSLYGN